MPTGAVFFTVDGAGAVTGTCVAGSSTTELCTAGFNTAALAIGPHTVTAAIATDTNYYQTSSTATNNLAVTAAQLAIASQGLLAFPQTAVGTTSTALTATFQFSVAGTIGAPMVLTKGATGLDFKDAGTGTCTTNGTSHAYAVGETCTVNVTFTPPLPGGQTGAVQLAATNGLSVASASLSGTGLAPLVTFPGNVSTTTLAAPVGSTQNISVGITVDGKGDIFFADVHDNTVKEVVAVNGVVPPGSSAVTVASGFNYPGAIALDGAGNLYVSDSRNNAIKKVIALNGVLSTTSQVLTLASPYVAPQGIAVDGNGNVFFEATDSALPAYANGALYEIAAVNGMAPVSAAVEVAKSFHLGYPGSGVAVDSDNNVYVAMQDQIVKFFAFSGSVSAGAATATLGQLFEPHGLAVDASGNIFVYDRGLGGFFEYHTYGGPQLLATNANSPYGTAVDRAGRLFLLDVDANGLLIEEIDRRTPPTVPFPATGTGATSTQAVSLENSGNQALTFPTLTTGANPSVTSGFSLTTTFPACSTFASGLVQTGICTDSITYSPTAAISGSGQLTYADNDLNAAGPGFARQVVPLVVASPGGATSITLGTTSTTAAFGTPLTLTATVSSTTTGTISGTVSFFDNGAAISAGTGLPLSSGSATLNISTLSVGQHSITATFLPAMGSTFTSSTTASGLTVTISQATATVSLGGLRATYDGSSHAATATTVPAGLNVSITYNGAATVPIAAGSYTVVATITDANYTGSATGTLVIAKASATVTLGNLSAAYDGMAHAATAVTSPAGLAVSLTYNGASAAPSAAGSYNVVATVTDSNYAGSATGTLVISQGTQNAMVTLSNLSATYDGSAHGVTSATTPAGLAVSVTYNGSTVVPTNAGAYSVVATVTSSGYSGSASGTLIIAKATAMVSLGNMTAAYDGNPHPAIATTNPAGLAVSLTYNGSGTAPSAVGSYAVVATITDANYTGSASGTLTISNATATVTLGSLNTVYTGSPQAVSVVTAPAGLSVSVSYNGTTPLPTNAGTYTVVATITSPGYSGSATGILTIAKANAALSLSSLTATYNGSPHAAIATTTPSGLSVAITYNGSSTAPSAVGSYAVVATVVDSNYSGSATGTLIIAATTTTADFSFTATESTAQTAAPLASVTYTFQVAPNAAGYPAAVTLTETGLPTGATVAFSPATIPASSGAQVVTMTVQAPATAAHSLESHHEFLFALLLLPFLGRRKHRERLGKHVALCICLQSTFAALAVLSGCGSGTGFTLQSSRDYTIVVSATSGTVQHTATVQLNVQ